MKRRTSSIKITSRRSSSSTTSQPTVARSFGFEQSFERRWDCSDKLKELYENYPLRFEKSPIFSRRRIGSGKRDVVIKAEVTCTPEMREEQRLNEAKIPLLRELPWNTKEQQPQQPEQENFKVDVVADKLGEKSARKNTKLKRNVTMPAKKNPYMVANGNKLDKTDKAQMRSLEDISFPPPPSPRSLRRYMNQE